MSKPSFIFGKSDPMQDVGKGSKAPSKKAPKKAFGKGSKK